MESPEAAWDRRDKSIMIPEGYDIAIVCENGHSINSSSTRFPESNAKFCKECGAKGISECASCSAPIRGYLAGTLSIKFQPPKYCHECGIPYPWTSGRIEATKELLAMSKLSEADKSEVIDAIILSTTDTPRTSVAAERLKKYWPAIGQTIQGVVTDVLSETAKKILFPK